MSAIKDGKWLLSDYPFQSNLIKINGVQLHYVDEGDKNDSVIFFIHGVPSWSYGFRKIIPNCVEAGLRAVAIDLPGFGRSDKPANSEIYKIENLVELLDEFVARLELKNVVLFVHDWGAIIGLILATKRSEYITGIIACNGLLPIINQKVPFLFRAWKCFTKYSPILPVGRIVDFGSNRKLTKEERVAYNKPFSERKKKNAIRILPQMIPLKKNEPEADLIEESWNELKKWNKPFLTIFSRNDPITKRGEKILQKRIPGAKNQAHQILEGKHFLQEDQPEELSRIIINFYNELK